MPSDTDLIFKHGTFGDRASVCVRWDDLERFLGHMHGGSPADDEILVQGLIDAGAPAWVRKAAGEIDEHFWILVEPEPDATAVDPITTDGWYRLTDGRYAFFSWDNGRIRQGSAVDDPAKAEADSIAAEDAYLEQRADLAAKSWREQLAAEGGAR